MKYPSSPWHYPREVDHEGATPLQEEHPIPRRTPSPGPRFIKAALIAGGTILAFNAVWNRNGWRVFPSKTSPDPHDGEVVTCELPWERIDASGAAGMKSAFSNTSLIGADAYPWDPQHYSKTAVTFPIDESSLLFFVSSGSFRFAQGHIKIVAADTNISTGTEQEGAAVVNVAVQYRSLRAFEDAKVCVLKRREGEHGIGVYVPHEYQGWQDRLRFLVTVNLPASRDRPLLLRALETDMPIFSHEFADLSSSVAFDAVRLRGINMPITVKSFSGKSFDARTTNAVITGTFNITHRLELETLNAPINAKVYASNRDWHEPTEVFIETRNAPVNVDAFLFSSNDKDGIKEMAPGLKLGTRTQNGLLHIAIPTAPARSRLSLHGTTSNGPAYLSLPPAFEGFILGRTSNAPIGLVNHKIAKDPSGQGRQRHVVVGDSTRGSLQAKTWWGDDEEISGLVEVGTSNGLLQVNLD